MNKFNCPHCGNNIEIMPASEPKKAVVEEKKTEDKQYREVKRTAKAGEKVKIVTTYLPEGYQVGDVCEIARTDSCGGVYIKVPQWITASGKIRNDYFINSDEYVVLEPYTEPTTPKEPTYYNGKVVCVEKQDSFTVGRVYAFDNGQVKDDGGTMRSAASFKAKSVDDWNDVFGSALAKFIEYKGETL